MKKIIIAIVWTFAVLMVLSVAKDIVVKVAVEKGVEAATGLKLRTQSFHVGVIRSIVHIKGLTIYNPSSFPEKKMLYMPEIYVDYDLPAILRKDIHLRQLRINLKEFIVVKNSKGELNLNSLKSVKSQSKSQSSQPAEKGTAPKIRIDEFYLKADKAVYKDYTSPQNPAVKEFNVNIDEKYSNITDAYTLVSLIVVRAISNTSISSLSNFDINDLKGSVSESLSTANKVASETVQKTQEAVKKASEAVKGVQDVFGALGSGK